MPGVTVYSLVPERARWRLVDGEIVLIHLESSFYYSLNETGSWLWQKLEQGACSRDELIESLAQRHELEPQVVAADVAALLESLQSEGFVKKEERA